MFTKSGKCEKQGKNRADYVKFTPIYNADYVKNTT